MGVAGFLGHIVITSTNIEPETNPVIQLFQKKVPIMWGKQWILLGFGLFLLSACQHPPANTTVQTAMATAIATNIDVQAMHRQASTPTATPLATTNAATTLPSPVPTDSIVKLGFAASPMGGKLQMVLYTSNGGVEWLVGMTADKQVFVADLTHETVSAVASSSQSSLLALAAYDGILYVLADDQQVDSMVLYARELSENSVLWSISIPKTAVSDYPPPPFLTAFASGVLLNRDGILTRFNQYDGNQQWQMDTKAAKDCVPNSNQIQVIENRIYHHCNQLTLVIGIDSGVVIQEIQKRHETKSSSSAYYQPTVYGDLLYYIFEADGEATLFARSLVDGTIRWQTAVSYNNTTDFALYGDALYLRDRTTASRHNAQTGTLIWATQLPGEESAPVLPTENYLYVGSTAGYLTLLDTETGEVVWQQDLWATLQPRYTHIKPVQILPHQQMVVQVRPPQFSRSWGNVVTGFNGSFAVLTSNEQTSQPIPTPTPSPPTSTPAPTPTSPPPPPTATPHPILTPPPAHTIPPAPPTMAEWPATITAFLNAAPDQLTQLDTLLANWIEAYHAQAGWEQADLDGDGHPEILLFASTFELDCHHDPTYSPVPPGWVFIIHPDPQNLAEPYRLVWVQPATGSRIHAIQDLNNDTLPDVIFRITCYGNGNQIDEYLPMGWYKNQFVTLLANRQTIYTSGGHDLRFEDVDQDGYNDIITYGGASGVVSGGETRNSTNTYLWRDDGYTFSSSIPDPHSYLDAATGNWHLLRSEYEQAIADFRRMPPTFKHHSAFAEYQLMLAYLLLGDEQTAVSYATSSHYPDEIYTDLKNIFWQNYLSHQDWTMACEATRTRAREIGFTRLQLSHNRGIGGAYSAITLENVCPCPDCLQETIEYGP